MEVKDRLKKILRLNNYGLEPISQAEFCRKIGVSSGYFSSMRKGLSFDKLQKILECYPDFDIKCLLTGRITPEGEVFNNGGKRQFRYESFIDFDGLIKEIESQKETIAKQKLIIKQLQEKIRLLEK